VAGYPARTGYIPTRLKAPRHLLHSKRRHSFYQAADRQQLQVYVYKLFPRSKMRGPDPKR